MNAISMRSSVEGEEESGNDRQRLSHASTSSLPRRVRPEERQYQSEMMFIGQRCHWHECHREDFLPFRCADCHHTFCSQHFRTAQHTCPTATPTFVVPLCPLCHEPPKDWKRDEDPNVAMNAHLTPNARTGLVECTAIDVNGTIRARAKDKHVKRENECQERRCRKLMVVPIACPSCANRFCPSHRAPNQHQCASLAANKDSRVGVQQSKSSTTPAKKLLDSLAAKRAKANENQSEKSNETGNSLPDKLNVAKAVSTANASRKVDKRTKQEKVSAIKAMQARHRKGLLTESEQMKLAEEMAAMKLKDENERKDCRIA